MRVRIRKYTKMGPIGQTLALVEVQWTEYDEAVANRYGKKTSNTNDVELTLFSSYT